MITLTFDTMIKTIRQLGQFLGLIVVMIAFMEAILYLLFNRRPKNTVVGIFMLLLTIGVMYAFMQVLWPIATPTKTVKVAIGLASVAVLAIAYWFLSEPRVSRVGLAYMLLAPALIGISLLIIWPFIFNIWLAFTDMSMKTAQNPTFGLQQGITNFRNVFTGTVARNATFWQVLWRTILWTVVNVVFHVTGGMALALLMNRPLRLKGLYRMLLVFPWAIPQTIAAMSLRNEFNYYYGFFNVILKTVGLKPISWLQDPQWAFVAVCLANIWLGIPFMMVIFLGGLQSISHEYYEAAEIDGASDVQQFWNITLPLMRPVMTPAVILGTVWTFNNLNVIYLITQGGPQERTDILVTSLYKAAFSFYRYGFAAAFALVIFAFLFTFAVIYLRATGGLKAVYE